MFTRKPPIDVKAGSSADTMPLASTPRVATPPPLSRGLHEQPSPAVDAEAREAGLVVIGRGTRVHGKIGDCQKLDVHGILEAEVVTEHLVVRDGGGFKGTVQTDNARIHGVFEGTLIVHDHLEIQSTGLVTGDVSYRTLAIQAGARIRGNIVCSEQDREAEEQVDAANVIPLSGALAGDGHANGETLNGLYGGHGRSSDTGTHD